LAAIALSAPLGGPLSVLAFFSLTAGFRALYGAGPRGLLPVLGYGTAFGLGAALAPLYAGPRGTSFLLAQAPFIVALGAILWLVAEALRRQDTSFVQQQLVNRSGATLVA